VAPGSQAIDIRSKCAVTFASDFGSLAICNSDKRTYQSQANNGVIYFKFLYDNAPDIDHNHSQDSRNSKEC